MGYHIRPVAPTDNAALKRIVIDVLSEFGCIGPGFACNDPEIEDMYATYQQEGSRYWVIIEDESQTVLGGGGFSRLRGTKLAENICELQKLYFLTPLRGKGLAKQLMAEIKAESIKMGYHTMYLETVPTMTAAIAMYQKLGFTMLKGPMGSTGHTSCPIYMALNLL